ncbi:MAG: CehA/McbA family metallohydrolase [Vicinamibacteraceae bacterium]
MPARVGVLGLLIPFFAVQAPTPSADLIVTRRMHHLRLGTMREWAEFAAQAEAAELRLTFTTTANLRERTLRLRHRDVKLAWHITLNDREIARLPADEADTVSYWSILPGTLRDGVNALRIHGNGSASDDVLIGDVRVIDRPRADVLTAATVDVAVVEAPDGVAGPSRITVTNDQGSLVSLGNTTDVAHAVRPGVVYAASGTVRLKLSAGRYVIHAGRGFEYGVDRATVDVANGEIVSRRLTIRREVDTAGWAAMDTHVHTATYARHGDATIDERMLTIAGEGLELPVSAEHNACIDFDELARAAGVRHYFTPVLGSEVTTPALGHFNVFPLAATSATIDQRLATWRLLGQAMDAAADRPAIVLNHGRDVHGGFTPLDASRHLGVAGEDLDGWALPANAMEIMNSGAVLSDGLALVRDWMAMLNRGLTLTPIGSSDSHDVARYIVGQGRTYVRVDDRRPDRLDLARVMDSVRGGHVMVSYGLLTEIDVVGHGPGELVASAGELTVRVRVQGPGWTRAEHVALHANGVQVREQAIADGTAPGLKFETTWRLPAPGHDVHLVAVATGPGIADPFWPTAKPYQPTSIAFTPYVLGVSGAVFVDADGSGRFDSASAYARQALSGVSRTQPLVRRLARYDAAVATQAASLLRAQDPGHFEATLRAMIGEAPPHVASGLRAYLDAWNASGRDNDVPRQLR